MTCFFLTAVVIFIYFYFLITGKNILRFLRLFKFGFQTLLYISVFEPTRAMNQLIPCDDTVKTVEERCIK